MHCGIVFDVSREEYKEKTDRLIRKLLSESDDKTEWSLIGFNSGAFILVEKKSKPIFSLDDIIYGGLSDLSIGLDAAKSCDSIYLISGQSVATSGKTLSASLPRVNCFCLGESDEDVLTSLSFFTRGSYTKI